MFLPQRFLPKAGTFSNAGGGGGGREGELQLPLNLAVLVPQVGLDSPVASDIVSRRKGLKTFLPTR